MNKPLLLTLLLNLFFIHFSNAQFHKSEKRIPKNKVSKQIKNYVEENYQGASAKYYKLETDKKTSLYEVKVKSKQEKILLIFDNNGNYMGSNNQVPYRDVPKESKKAMNTYLSSIYSDYKVSHCRFQKIGDQRTYNLDVTTKKTKYRYRFKSDGSLIDFKEIPQKTLDLLFN